MASQSINVELQTPDQIERRAKQLEGMSFRDVLNLGIAPEGVNRTYNSRRYKGGMGTLIEERFFGYKANSDREPDFAEAGVELKATCIDTRRDGTFTAGERLVLTMIPFDVEAPLSLYDSHLWHKCKSILLVWYRRDKSKDPYDQTIEYTALFTPPARDLSVMEKDYTLITNLIRSGRADELSESLTTYLGACTKGATRAKSMRDQSFYAPGKRARGRAFAYKRSYMDYVLHHYIMGEPEAESVIKDPRELERQTLEEYVTKVINAHVGKTDRELCEILGIDYTGNKAQWTTIAYRMLGIQGDRAAEFEKAGIRVRTIRPEKYFKSLKESFPVMNINFLELAEEENWEESKLRCYLEELRYLFVVFEKTGRGKNDSAVLRGSVMWSIPISDLDGPVRTCWERTVRSVRNGVQIRCKEHNGGVTFYNDFPKKSDELVAHVRPRAKKAAYILDNGIEVGNVERDAEGLPDGRFMTRQAFWLNSDYVLDAVHKSMYLR